MTGQSIDTNAAVQAAKDVTSNLSASGKAAVLEHFLSDMTQDTLEALSPGAKARLVAKLIGGLQGAKPPEPYHHANFNESSVQVPYKGQLVRVGVPYCTFGESLLTQILIAEELGGEIVTQALNLSVANYLLDREAFDLLAREKADTITEGQKGVLQLHREKWQEDTAAEARAKEAGAITDKEADLLQVYRTKWVRDFDGGLSVKGVYVSFLGSLYCDPYTKHGALVVDSSAQSK